MLSNVRVVAVMEARTVTGPARNLLRFCDQIRQRPSGIELSVAAFVRDGQAYDQFLDAVRAGGIDLDVIRERRRFDLKVVSQLTAILDSRRAQILQTHGIKGHALASMPFVRGGRKWIAFHHGYTAEDTRMRFYNSLNRWTLPRADCVITVCQPFAQMLSANGVNKERIEVLPNTADPAPAPQAAAIEEWRQRLNLQPAELVIVCIGRFSAEKGHLDLVAAADRLRSLLSGVRFRVVLVGEGVERARVEREVAQRGLGDYFVFPGHQRDIQPFYHLAHLLVLPSHSEGSPNVVLEAMAATVPIVATAVGGVPDTLRHEHSALLVAPHRPEELAEAMGRMLTDRALAGRLACRAAADLREHFTPAAYAERLTRIYRRFTCQ